MLRWLHSPPDDDDNDSNDVEDKIPEDAVPERKDEATFDGDIHSALLTFPLKGGDSGPRNWASGTDGGFQVDFVRTPPRAWTGRSSLRLAWLDVVCGNDAFHITLLIGQLKHLNVLGGYLHFPPYLKPDLSSC